MRTFLERVANLLLGDKRVRESQLALYMLHGWVFQGGQVPVWVRLKESGRGESK